MGGIDATRQKEIDLKVLEAVTQKLKDSGKPASSKADSVSIFIDKMTAEEKEYAYKKYSESILNNVYDANSDSEVSVNEMGDKEMADMLAALKAEGAKDAEGELSKVVAKRNGYLFAQNLDVNNDGKISVDEFSYFLKETDMSDDEKHVEQDGVFTKDSESTMFKSVTATNVKDQELKVVAEKYLRGDNLSAEEQKKLNDGSLAIRTAEKDRAQEFFKMDLGTVADKNVYVGDNNAAPGTSATTVNYMDNTFSKTLVEFIDNSMRGNNVSFMDNSAQNKINFLGGGNYGGGMNYGMGMNYGFQNSSAPAGKWWQIGNIAGQGLGMLGMIGMLFNGGIFGGRGHGGWC